MDHENFVGCCVDIGFDLGESHLQDHCTYFKGMLGFLTFFFFKESSYWL